MQPLTYLFLHCSATDPLRSRWNADRIRRAHMDPVAKGGRGWDRPGYRVYIEVGGKVVRLIEANDDAWVQPGEVSWGVGPAFNGISHHICYEGGLANGAPTDTRDLAQRNAMLEICNWYISKHPNIQILGHNQVANKACPSFFVPHWGDAVGLPSHNLDRRDPFGYGKIFKA